MARHHIRDNEGNLHFFNDEEYKQYKYRNGCLGVLALLILFIGGLLNTCKNDKDSSSSSSKEQVINSEVQNSTEKDDRTTNLNLLMDEKSQVEETEEIEAQESNEETNEETQEESSFTEVTNDASYSENTEESFSEDQKSLKKLQKEERKRQKQLEKEAKRKAKEDAKEAKRRAKEEAKRLED